MVIDLRPDEEEASLEEAEIGAEKQSPSKSLTVDGPLMRKRSSERSQSLSPHKKLKVASFVGFPAKVWWKGENQYFPGIIEDFNEETNQYKIVYEDGGVDNNMKFLNYEVIMNGNEINYIKVDANNLNVSENEEEEE